jgi:hypothetical protein
LISAAMRSDFLSKLAREIAGLTYISSLNQGHSSVRLAVERARFKENADDWPVRPTTISTSKVQVSFSCPSIWIKKVYGTGCA